MTRLFEAGASYESVTDPTLQVLFAKAESDLCDFDPIATDDVHRTDMAFLDRVSELHDPYPLNRTARARLQNSSVKLAQELDVVDRDSLTKRSPLVRQAHMGHS